MRAHINEGDLLPQPPEFTEAEYASCKVSGSWMPMVFEWYKWTGLTAIQVACLDPKSPGYATLQPVHIAALRGLLNRVSRLMVAVLRLASTRKHGEATKLLNRSVAETAITLRWLCMENSPESFSRYFAGGLKSELRLKDEIEKEIASRNGVTLVVEDRMLSTIAEMIHLAGMSESEVRQSKPLPDLASMYRTLALPELAYTVMQRLGSHAVHGTWPDLLFHYLEDEQGTLVPRDNNAPAEDTELGAAAIFVLEAIHDFAQLVCVDPEFAADLGQAMKDTIAELSRLQHLKSRDDYAAV